MSIMNAIIEFFQRYWATVEWDPLIRTVINKLLALLLLLIFFYTSKKLLRNLFHKTILSSLQLSNQSIARQKTLMRLLENSLNYFLYSRIVKLS